MVMRFTSVGQMFHVMPAHLVGRLMELVLLGHSRSFKYRDDRFNRRAPRLPAFQFGHHNGGVVTETPDFASPRLDSIDLILLQRALWTEQVHTRSSSP